MSTIDKIYKEIEEEIVSKTSKIIESNVGYITELKDEVVFLEGFDNVRYGEIITFENGVNGLVVDLSQTNVGCIIFGDYTTLKEGDMARGSGKIFSIPVGEALLGRVVSGLASPIDNQGPINTDKYYPVERIAPGVVFRQSVSVALQTGIKGIDAVIPIGRGQRELIIGDRGTGKSTIAIDTIINQHDQNVICIYCIIGQKRATTASLIETLRKHKAMDYSIIVAATASDPAAIQFVAPYVATAIGEYFMDKGKDVLVIYDDLTKHAWAYRQVSLILRRPSGREAYPGDIFYLHSRLLERSCRLDDKNGGGSMTALPIVETQEGDVSSYIPTNIISITDGQIFLETDLFNKGIRPAINVGTSVSRVGSSAQTKAMKKVGGKLRFDLAQYRELAAFAQFESELDERTKNFLDRGARMTELLKQKKNHTLDLAHEVVIIWCGVNGYLDNIPINQVVDFENKFIDYLEGNGAKIIKLINQTKEISDEVEKELHTMVKKFITLNYQES
ncbi:F0F1 ATP synthase subunit alpha [Candidatus Roizmanbacteria bacterium RIFCSPHIGHO2_02_FULL_37_13b]|uniref:ATP synthase subunit alpha n=1 Tax=Candidatus Roizmanbacteria bacterium RIFCSPLOWO2_02_FULL_36_11 TaxID=1802071 RepID=A0A1F7JG16_9BACT|nr:MAG: F0F1 ATP synthase subunit alpha [Candidatus Roizmanbacteria bacterium RIFCSPHIGHO2_02_FULL_37_13b]OGK54545.1 MAG: F0F1 ATP synthase subunit alpha [Candidatus Roizmanbacteria bacterium RIFCSPLOWO2_02_FULL_36_11]